MTNIQNNQMVTTLKIDGMSCDHCVRAVEKALRGVDGVESASVDLAQGTATVQGNADAAAMIAAVADAGYNAAVQEL